MQEPGTNNIRSEEEGLEGEEDFKKYGVICPECRGEDVRLFFTSKTNPAWRKGECKCGNGTSGFISPRDGKGHETWWVQNPKNINKRSTKEAKHRAKWEEFGASILNGPFVCAICGVRSGGTDAGFHCHHKFSWKDFKNEMSMLDWEQRFDKANLTMMLCVKCHVKHTLKRKIDKFPDLMDIIKKSLKDSMDNCRGKFSEDCRRAWEILREEESE